MHGRAVTAGLIALVGAMAGARAAPGDADALLQSLIGKDRGTIERRLGLPDEDQSNGVQTFLQYRTLDARRTSGSPDPFGYYQGFSGGLGFRGKASFRCSTTLVLTDGVLRAYSRRGNDCR